MSIDDAGEVGAGVVELVLHLLPLLVVDVGPREQRLDVLDAVPQLLDGLGRVLLVGRGRRGGGGGTVHLLLLWRYLILLLLLTSLICAGGRTGQLGLRTCARRGGGRLTLLLLRGSVLESDRLFEHPHLFRRESAVLGEEHDLLQEGRLLVALVGGEEDVLEVGEGGGRVAGELRRVQVVDCVAHGSARGLESCRDETRRD
jgi:hypothetical protein